MRSVMQHSFARVPQASIPRSSFDRSHGYKSAFDAGYLIPFFVDEALPGDTFNARLTAFARMATPIYPIMDNLFMDFFFFAVPNRLLWQNWEKFNGAQDNPGDSIDFTIPTKTSAGPVSTSGVVMYMGVPVGATNIEYSALPLRAYQMIWNEWFRDQNLQNSVTVSVADGPDTTTSAVLQRRGKRHDYFTSCLPWPQKGDSVPLPLGSTAPVGTSVSDTFTGAQEPLHWLDEDGSTIGAATILNIQGTTGDTYRSGTGGSVAAKVYPSNLFTDLSSATAATINQLRQAFQIQKIQERDARGGTRYIELIKAHFGVTSPDARMQRPEYLGGGSIPVHVSAVATTAIGDTNHTKVGNLAAIGTASGQVGFVKSFTEHCTLIGLVSVRADLTYQQGLDRMWSRQTRYDFYLPALATIGEQAVLNKEIFYQDAAADDDVFGYQERYAEYRYKPSKITGILNSNAASSLDAWHLSQDFASLPALDSTFIQEDPPIDRVIAVDTEPHFIFDSYMSMRCARPMPMFGVPGLIDHF